MRSPLALTIGAMLAAGPVAAIAQNPNVVIFTGVVSDSLRRPLENAEVSLPGLKLSKTTNDKGLFRFAEVPPGSHRVIVRQIGFGQMDTLITFEPQQNVEWRVTLGRIVTLDSVIVSAPIDPLMAEFESNRARGFGRFMNRAELARFDGATLPNVVSGMPGTAMTRTRVGTVYITSKRQPMAGCSAPKPRVEGSAGAYEAQAAVDACLRRERVYYVPEEIEARQGVPRACFPQVFVDRTLMNSGAPTPPFDLNTFATDQIEAIEWYESAGQTPPKYSVNNAKCGVLVLHMRKRK